MKRFAPCAAIAFTAGLLMLQIDLRAPTVLPTQRVWRLFPGEGYQFLDSFIEQNVGFLDLPGLKLPQSDILRPGHLLPHIAFSQKMRDLLWDRQDEKAAELKIDDFITARNTQNRGRIRQAIINLFYEAKAGDFVIIPEPVYFSQIWVGWIPDNVSTFGYFQRRYGNTPIPARNIRWIRHIPESMISVGLSKVLRHQNPFTLLEKNLFLEAFSIAYGSFVYGDRCASTIFNENDFLDSDAALLGAISRLSAAAAISVDTNQAALNTDDLLGILLRSPPIEYTCSQEIDIHSPGFNRYVSGSIVPLVIAAVTGSLLWLSQYSSKDKLAIDLPALHIVNTGPNADPHCTMRVSEASRRVLTALGTDRTWALCEAARAARERAGLKSSATPVEPVTTQSVPTPRPAPKR